LAGHLALLPHVRGVMAMVGRGEAAAGIGYETDLGVSGGVRLVGVFPPAVAPPVVFPIAVIAGHESPEVEEAYRRILGPGGRVVLRAHGFADPAP
jgi:molybdate transport system substrate-binding protein